MFRPEKIYCEKDIENYTLGRELLEKYKDIPKTIIENHNNIEEMRKQENSQFPKMKRNLIIGTRKTQKFVENHKVSDFLVPYTSSGCTAMCMYNNLVWTIENFAQTKKGKLTLPTKFDMVDDILGLEHNKKIIIRMSVNPDEIINKVEFGTARLKERIVAINKLADADYEIGILIAPVIFVENWKNLYLELIKILSETLNENTKRKIFFEIIFMTYSYVHNAINTEAFPNAINLFDKDLMRGRGKGKYMYKDELRKDGDKFFSEQIKKYFGNTEILYIV